MNKDYDRDRDKKRKRKEFKLKSVEKKENISQRNKLKHNLREYIEGGYDKTEYFDDDKFE